MQTKQSLAIKAAYWLKVVSLGMVLGLGLQFAQAWVAPGGAPPAGNVAGPLTTGASSQAKSGGLTLGGLLLSGKANCDLKTTATGLVTCGVDATASGGGITSLSAGTGITLSPNPITATGTVSVDSNYVQRRVSAACAVGSSIRTINADGTVACESAAAASVAGTWCGLAYYSSPTTDNPNSGGTIATCMGVTIQPSYFNSVGTPPAPSCPSGYVFRKVQTGQEHLIGTCIKQ